MAQAGEIVVLPQPSGTGSTSLEQLLAQRRSIRDYQTSALELADIGQLLWAAQGITHTQGLRAAPSAGALYPLELYVVTGHVEGLAQGVYHYDPGHHQLLKTSEADLRDALTRAALSQNWIKQASAIIVFTADYKRTTRKYGKRGKRYVHIEAGHAAQNLFLQSGSLGLATVVVGAFNDNEVASVLRLPADLQPLLLMPVGRKK
jgi:SagB-type dehydrogenase family enzyme